MNPASGSYAAGFPAGTEGILVGTILIMALAIRLWGIDFALPYIYHPDEVNKIAIAQGIFKTGDLNPHYFKKPTLFIYLNALAYVPYYLLGRVFGAFQTPADILPPVSLAMGVAHAQMPSTVIMGRLLTVFFATATIPFVFFLGKQLGKTTSSGVLAALMMAVSPTHVQHSRYITENIFLVFFVIFSVWASVRLYQKGRTGDYAMAGIAAGLAASSKYPGVLVAVVPLCAHFLRLNFSEGMRDFRFFLCLGLVPAAFFATTPFALMDCANFLKDAFSEVEHYATGHPGMDGNSFVWYLSYAWQTAGLISIVALLEMGRGVYSRSRGIILLSLFPLVYFLFISFFVVRNDRTYLPVEPLLFVLAASFMVHIFDKARKIEPTLLKRTAFFVGISFTAVCFLQPVFKTVSDTIKLTRTDGRETARIWVNENLPAGARIALESYSPFFDPSRFRITGFGKMIEHGPQWFIDHGYDYAIFSQGMYGRFYEKPEKYGQEIDLYDKLFSRFSLVRVFTEGGYEVRVYKVG